MYHSFQLETGTLEVVVDDANVILPRVRHLLAGVCEAQAHLLLVLGSTAAQTTLELVHAGRLDKDENRLGHDGADREAALDVDLQDDGLTARKDALDLALQRAVAMGVHPRPLEELSRRKATVKLLVVHEVIGDAIGLPGARLPSRRRDRQAKTGDPLAQLSYERALAYA